MKSTNAILLALAATLVLAPSFSGCSEEAGPPQHEAKDIEALQEQQKQIIQRERGLPSKKAPKG